MNETLTSSMEGVTAGLQNIVTQLMQYLPRLAAAIIVLVFGWLLARLLRMLIVRAISRLDQYWQRLVAKRGLEKLQPRHSPARIVGELLFWLLMLIFVTLATDILGLDIFVTWLKAIVAYLPLAAAAILIVLVGFVISVLVRDLVVSAATSAGMSHGNLLGRAAQAIILFTAAIIGIDQIGIDITFLSVAASIILAAMLGGVALAFGLGARTHVSNIIAANQLRSIYEVGDKVRIGDIEGQLMNISLSRVSIETEDGSVDVPAKLFDEQVTKIIKKEA